MFDASAGVCLYILRANSHATKDNNRFVLTLKVKNFRYLSNSRFSCDAMVCLLVYEKNTEIARILMRMRNRSI